MHEVHHRTAGAITMTFFHHGMLVEQPVLVARLDQLVLRRAGVGDELGEHPGVGPADPCSGRASGPGGSIPTSLT